MNLTDKIKGKIRDVKDFPKEGIIFKDITPVLADSTLTAEIVQALAIQLKPYDLDAVAGIESRGFFFGILIAQKLDLPFIPVRKEGKLPFQKIQHSYDLEYGRATVEMHRDAIGKNDRVLIHDDLLATGGTAKAAAELVKKLGGEVAAFSFLIELSFLNGATKLRPYADIVDPMVKY